VHHSGTAAPARLDTIAGLAVRRSRPSPPDKRSAGIA